MPDIERRQVKAVPYMDAAEDGRSAIIPIQFSDGSTLELEIPFCHLDFLAQAAIKTANQCHKNQIAGGEELASNPLLDVFIAETVRLLPQNGKQQGAILQVQARKNTSDPSDILSIRFAQTDLKYVGERFLTVAEELRQKSKLS